MTARKGSRGRPLRALVWLALFATGLLVAQIGSGADTPSRVAVVLNLEGAIGPASADYVARGIRRARASGASAVVLRMDTPGGLDTSMREIIRAILASPVPVLGFVGPSGARAASAGTYILYACHVAAMAPGTNLGAATPVSIGGGLPFGGGDRPNERPNERPDEGQRGGRGANGGSASPSNDSAAKDDDRKGSTDRTRARAPDSPMETKVINDAVAYIRSLAELRGRNADWAESAVREAASLSATDAKARDVIDLIAADVADLLAKADGRTVAIGEQHVVLETRGLQQEPIEPDWRSRLLAVITNPSLALILMTIGFYGLIFEFIHPGAIYPGTVGGICLLLGLYALSVLPVNFAGLGLILLGLALMVAEAFTPTAGAAAVGGAVAFVLGATILIDTEAPGFGVPWTAIGFIVAASLAFSLLVLRMLWQARRRPALTGHKGMLGERGRVLEWSGNRGRVQVAGERWHAVCDMPLAAGQSVRVTAVEGLVLHVVAAT